MSVANLRRKGGRSKRTLLKTSLDRSSQGAFVTDVQAMAADTDALPSLGEPETTGRPATRLVVFSDDFGRHPSSSQHLIRELLATNLDCCERDCDGSGKYQALWVNTVGTRRPSLSLDDVSRAAGKLRGWAGGVSGSDTGTLPEELTVIDPKMWPGFRRPWQRKFNARSITNAVHRALGPRVQGEQRIVITTLPITADLVGKLDVDQWVYYCVDDFSVWPGMDSEVMQTMERELIGKVDDVVAVSTTLQERIASIGKTPGHTPGLLTHGIDQELWSAGGNDSARPNWWPIDAKSVAVFWGLIDRRLDMDWCRALSGEFERLGDGFVLAGPQQNPDPGVHALPGTVLPGRVAYKDLPGLAPHADVLVMPYIDAEVTRAMQPLKLKEYLATMRPVVVRDLPATREWADCCDVVASEGEFVRVCLERAKTGLPDSQRRARECRLASESWSQKARVFARIWSGPDNMPMRNAA